MEKERKSIVIAPATGWEGYGRSAELLGFLFEELLRRHGWHYLNFTSDTAIFEAPESGGSLYLQTDKSAGIAEAILYPPDDPDPEFDALATELAERFGLKEG